MAAVFALIFLPALAAVGLMLLSAGAMSFGTLLAMLCFVAMTAGVFYGSLKLAYKWEHEAPE